MSTQEMIILGLVASGRSYAFEMDDFVEKNSLRDWLPLGSSTIYKLLPKLARDGCLSKRREKGSKGPKRTAYELTDAGQQRLAKLTADHLRSQRPVHSDRIAALLFAPATNSAQIERAARESLDGLERLENNLIESQHARSRDEIAIAIIQFYRDVAAAERAAILRLVEQL